MTERIVIVGAGLAGAKAAETLRDEGYPGSITLVGDEPDRPYERPPLSKGQLLGSAEPEAAYVHSGQWYEESQVDLRTGQRVTGIDRAARVVELAEGERLPYDRLLLSTGSSPIRLDLPGSRPDGLRYLRTMADSAELDQRLTKGTRVVVIGAGWIGLELAAAARTREASVDVVELAELPLLRVLGPEVGRLMHDLHRSAGVTFHLGTGVDALRADSVVLGNGTVLPADLIVAGVGVRPNVELAQAAGLDVANGIVTDESLRTSDVDIFAAGDVASWWHPLLGRHVRVEHWANALHGGPAAAKAMLGQGVVYDPVPYFFSDQFDLGMEYAGYVEPGGYDRVVFRGDPSVVDGKAPEVIAFWLKDNRVLAGMNVNVWDVTDDIQALVRAGYSGSTVDPARLADPDVPLSELIR